NLRIMLPMVSSVPEVEEALHLIHRAHGEVQDEGCNVPMPPIGVMIEVPAAVYQAAELVRMVDFLSVGTNDLTQYLLAVDRNNPRVADLYHSFHPAVLKALQLIARACREAGKPMSVCGEMAGDPAAAVLLLALGCDVLSMSASSLPRVKWLLRQISLDDARALLRDALREDNAYLVQSMLHLSLRNMGLGKVLQPLRSVPRTWSLPGRGRIRPHLVLSCTRAGRAGAPTSREGPLSGCPPTRGLANPARFAQLLPVGAEVPLDEGNAAVGVDGQQAAGTGAV